LGRISSHRTAKTAYLMISITTTLIHHIGQLNGMLVGSKELLPWQPTTPVELLAVREISSSRTRSALKHLPSLKSIL
jgi:hypothetical protein